MEETEAQTEIEVNLRSKVEASTKLPARKDKVPVIIECENEIAGESTETPKTDDKSEVEERVADALKKSFDKCDQPADITDAHFVAEEDYSDKDDDEDALVNKEAKLIADEKI